MNIAQSYATTTEGIRMQDSGQNSNHESEMLIYDEANMTLLTLPQDQPNNYEIAVNTLEQYANIQHANVVRYYNVRKPGVRARCT